MDFSTIFIQKTIQAIQDISVNENIKFDYDVAKEKMQKTLRDKIKKSIEVIRQDTLDADFGLKSKNLTSIQKTTMMISLQHECTMYAKEIFDFAKIV